MARETISADLIADIYEAAVDNERWPDIAEIVAKATGMPGCGVWYTIQGQVRDLSLTADILATQGPYVAHYFKHDLWALGHMRGPWGRVRIGYELCPEDELVKTEFYNDFARPNGIVRPMGVMMQLSRGTFATVSLNPTGAKRLIDDSDKPRLERLVPHLQRALQLRLTQRRHALTTPMHAAALDALAFGVIVCDAAGRIVLVNKAAESIARVSAGIILNGRRKGIETRVPAETRALAALTHDAATGGPGGIMRITGRSGGAELIALVTPLPRSVGITTNPRSAYALVTLRSALDDPSFSAETLIALFRLSPAQAAIALAIFNGKSPEQIAVERGVAITTLRTHLAEIFARTGAENQRDLIRLLGMLPPIHARRANSDEMD
jgi:DNA-binding CsgD family transcriptional regulator/PAS domain-containing protein